MLGQKQEGESFSICLPNNLQNRINFVSLQSQNESSGKRRNTGLGVEKFSFRGLQNLLKFSHKTFGQLEKSLYFCTRNSATMTDQLPEEKREEKEIIDIQITTKKVRKNQNVNNFE